MLNANQENTSCPALKKEIIAIITRFNIDIGMTPCNCTANINLDKEYLKKRFELFENYYLKSLVNQTNSDFYCFILMHPQTPEEFKERFFSLARNCSFKLLPVFVKDFDLTLISREIYQYIKNYQFLISVRLDNDDSVAASFVEKLYAENHLKENYIISFSNGSVYDIKSGFTMYYYNKQNHFLAYVEKVQKDINTIYAISEHDKIFEKHPYIICIDSESPMWMENIHDSNLRNKLVGRPMSRRLKKIVTQEYSFLQKIRIVPPPSAWLFLMDKVLQKTKHMLYGK